MGGATHHPGGTEGAGSMTRETERPAHGTLLSIGLAAALVATSCTGGGSVGESRPSDRIPQPSVSGVQVAPESARVDLTVPTFSHPTDVTNPLFPVSRQASVLLLGHVDGEPFRTEVTLLPDTRVVEWEGERVETLVSQYVAYLNGSIQEVAYDLYAQADDGSVWYFGEDVFDFRKGAIVVTEGTWLAGRDGPAAMIMPANPRPGDVYRSENAPGFVFEQVTVKSVTKSLDGPLGPIDGGMVGEELHMDGAKELKLFAPGYGEFFTGGGGDVEALALAVPTDEASGPMPTALAVLSGSALSTIDAARVEDWRAASNGVRAATAAWKRYESVGAVPRRIGPRMRDALAMLAAKVNARARIGAQSSAIDVARSAFDLQLQYRPVPEIDLARLDLWAAQLLVDQAAGDADAVGADAFALDYVRDRLVTALDAADLDRVDTEVGAIQVGVADQDLAAAADATERLRARLAQSG
jgi:hypothetical protein